MWGPRRCSRSCTEWDSYPFNTTAIMTSELVAQSRFEPVLPRFVHGCVTRATHFLPSLLPWVCRIRSRCPNWYWPRSCCRLRHPRSMTSCWAWIWSGTLWVASQNCLSWVRVYTDAVTYPSGCYWSQHLCYRFASTQGAWYTRVYSSEPAGGRGYPALVCQ